MSYSHKTLVLMCLLVVSLMSGCGAAKLESAQLKAMSTLPAGATVVGTMEVDKLFDQAGRQGLQELLQAQAGARLADLTQSGLTTTGITDLTFWMANEQEGPALILTGHFDATQAAKKMSALGQHAKAIDKGTVVIAEPALAQRVVAAREGDAPRLDLTKAPGRYLQQLGSTSGAVIAATGAQDFAGRISLDGDVAATIYLTGQEGLSAQVRGQLASLDMALKYLSPKAMKKQLPSEAMKASWLDAKMMDRIIAIAKELITSTEFKALDDKSVLLNTRAGGGDELRAITAKVLSLGLSSVLLTESRDAKVAMTKAQLNAVTNAIEIAKVKTGTSPPSLNAVLDAGLITKSKLNDPWSQPLRYAVSTTDNRGYTLCSKGPDTVAGNADDICID